MKTIMKRRNLISKAILAYGIFFAMLFVLTCPSTLWQVGAQNSIDDGMGMDDMDMELVFRPIGMAGAIDDGSIANSSPDPSYITLPDPLLVAFGINNSGNIVGFYKGTDSKSHGFLYNRVTRSFASIDYNNPVCKTGTDARGINQRGDIVGTCTDDATNPDGSHNFYGYLLTADGFSSVHAQGHLSTIPQRISSDGKIVGCIHDTNQTTTMFGQSVDSQDLQFVDPSSGDLAQSFFTFFGGIYGGLSGRGFMNNGVSPSGRIVVGWFTDSSVTPARARAYILRDGVVTPFDYPVAGVKQTLAWDVNAEGDVVGWYQDQANKVHGFLRSPDGEFTSIDFPFATLTRAFGINTNGDIVGTYIAGGVQHAFVRSAKLRWDS